MTDDDIVALLCTDFDAILLDVGATLVAEAQPGTAVADLRAHPLPGVVDALRGLAGRVRLAAVTNTATMTADDVRALLDPADIGEHLEFIVTSADVGAAKPDPTVVRVALERLGVPAARALVVGDAISDRQAAFAAGVSFVATDRGLPDALFRAVTSRRGAFAAGSRTTPTARPGSFTARSRTTDTADQAGGLAGPTRARCRAIVGDQRQLPPTDPTVSGRRCLRGGPRRGRVGCHTVAAGHHRGDGAQLCQRGRRDQRHCPPNRRDGPHRRRRGQR